MGDILRTWLGTKVGIDMKAEPEEIAKLFRDGTAFSMILSSYSVMDGACVNLKKSDDPCQCLNNLKQLCVWFKMLNLDFDEETLKAIANGSVSTILRFTFDLYVALENKNHLWLTNAEGKQKSVNETYRFKVTKVVEQKPEPLPSISKRFTEPLMQRLDVIEKYRKMQDDIILKCEEDTKKRRMELLKECKKHDTLTLKEDLLTSMKSGKGEGDIMKEIKAFNRKLEAREHKPPDFKFDCTPADFVDYLKLKRRKTNANLKLKKDMKRLVLQHISEKLLKQEEEELHTDLSRKFIKQSEYEKEMVVRLGCLHFQHEIFKKNRLRMNAKMEQTKQSMETMKNTFNALHGSMEDSWTTAEQVRIFELHRRLYRERLRLKFKKHRDICREIMNDITNLAVKCSEYKNEFRTEVPKRTLNEWKALFYKGLPMFQSVDIDSILLKEKGEETGYEEVEEEIDEDLEFAIEVDKERVEAVNEADVRSYLYLLGPWMCELWPELGEWEENQNCLGYTVHRSLENKYPFPEPPPPAELPEYPVRVVVNDLNDAAVVDKLQSLLSTQVIRIFDVQQVINYNLEEYKKEIGLSDVGDPHDNKTKEKKQPEKPKKTKGATPKSDKKNANKVVDEKVDKETQYPSIQQFPLPHSKAGVLGKVVFEAVTTGGVVSDVMVAQMTIEYLKNLKDINGWVLLNYPITCNQVTLVEFVFSGLEAPIVCQTESSVQLFIGEQKGTDVLYDLSELIKVHKKRREDYPSISDEVLVQIEASMEQIESENILMTMNYVSKELDKEEFKDLQSEHDEENAEHENEEEKIEDDVVDGKIKISMEELQEFRTSKLVPRPNPEPEERPFQSYFTKVITMLYKGVSVKTIKKEKQKPKGSTFKSDTANSSPIEEEEVIEDQDSKAFYETQGIHQFFHYTALDDLEVLKNLAKTILGEFEKSEVLRKTSEELFGKDILKALQKTRKSQAKGDGKGGKGKEKGKKAEEKDKKEVVEEPLEIPPEPEAEIAEEEIVEEEAPVEIIEIHPGEDGWIYSNPEMSKEALNYLATLWEHIEYYYLSNIKEIFYLLRVNRRSLLPYRNYIRDAIDEAINFVDERQDYVTEFQNMFNAIAIELRRECEVKCELHCRIFELQSLLYKLCDDKKDVSEARRVKLIKGDWLVEHLFTMSNLYLSFVQTEVDRFIDTYQFLSDYHLIAVGKIPQSNVFEKISVRRIKRPQSMDDSKNSAGSNRNSDEIQIASFSRKGTSDDKELKSDLRKRKMTAGKIKGSRRGDDTKTETYAAVIQQMLRHKNESEVAETPFHAALANVIDEVEREVEHWCTKINDLITNESGSLLRPAERKGSKKGDDKPKNTSKNKKKLSADKPIEPTLEEIEAEIRLTKIKTLFEEWRTAVQNEKDREIFRLRLIKNRALADMSESTSIITLAFHTTYSDIIRRYRREIDSVTTLSNIFKSAIEDETAIQPLITLEQDRLCVNNKIQCFPNIPPPPPTPLEELSTEFNFTVDQLTSIMEKMTVVAPLGIIEGPFVSILQDMSTFGDESGYPYLPPAWSLLTTKDIRYILRSIFGRYIFVDWKDFLLYGLKIPFPSISEIVEMRAMFSEKDPDLNEVVSYDDYKDLTLWFEKDLQSTLTDDLRVVKAKEFIFKLFQVNETEMNYTAMLFAFCKDEDPVEGFGKALALISGSGFILSEDKIYLRTGPDEEESYLVASQIMELILFETLRQTEGIILTEIFDDLEVGDEFEEGEQLIREAEAEMGEGLGEEEAVAEEEPTFEDLHPSIIWKTMVHFDVVLTLICTSLHHYALSHRHVFFALDIERKLTHFYKKFGDGKYVKAWLLMEWDFMKTLFDVVPRFQIFDLALLVKRIIESSQSDVLENK